VNPVVHIKEGATEQLQKPPPIGAEVSVTAFQPNEWSNRAGHRFKFKRLKKWKYPKKSPIWIGSFCTESIPHWKIWLYPQ